ncbi:MAG: hypothetical protein ABFD69_04870 [Candidatus Sumerlaeia bacterium]
MMIFALAAALPLSARAATTAASPSPGGVVQLPAVENETPSSPTPVISPDQVQPAAATPAPPSVTFKSVNEAREKIRRAYLLRQYDAVLELSRAAAVQFPEEQAFEFYVKRAESMLRPTDDASEHSPAFRRLRDKRRNESIQSIMKSVGQTTASAVAATAVPADSGSEKPGPVAVAPADSAKPAGQAKPAVEKADAEEQAPPPPPPVRRASAMDKIKNLVASPAVLYGAIGVVVLAIAGAVIMRRKGAAKARPEPAAAQPETALDAFEPQPAAQPAALGDMDSLFKPAEPAPQAEEPKTSIDNLDALFASASDPTRVSAPQAEPSVQDSLDSFFKTESEPRTEVTASAPIKLDDAPIELPSVNAEPAPVESGPITIPEFEPVSVAPISLDSAPAEEIAPISIDVPAEDPFFSKPQAEPVAASAPEPAEEMQTTRIEFADLPSFEEETKVDEPVADVDEMLKPIVPEIMEPPSGMQPEYAATRGFVDNPTASSTAFDETSTAMDLPAVDVTPTVAVHEDETLVLDDAETMIDQSTAISPSLPVDGGSPENGSGGSDDLFSREYHKGMSDFVISNWAGAVHHLSIAAALRPSAVEVKEKLREARKRRKETEE